MATVTESVDVAVPIRVAYDQWTQFEDFPRFMEGVEEVRQIDATTTHWVVRVGAHVREFDAVISEQHPELRVAWSSTGDLRHAGVVTFHRLDDALTRVTVQMELTPEGLVEHAGTALGVLNRRVRDDLGRFKRFIEERRAPTGAWHGDVPRPDLRRGQRAQPRPAAPAGGGVIAPDGEVITPHGDVIGSDGEIRPGGGVIDPGGRPDPEPEPKPGGEPEPGPSPTPPNYTDLPGSKQPGRPARTERTTDPDGGRSS